MSQSSSSNEIDVAAAHWAVRTACGELTPEEQVAFGLWIEADPRHRGALLRAQAAWLDLDRLAALAGRPAQSDVSAPKTNRVGAPVPRPTADEMPHAPADEQLSRINTRRRNLLAAASAAVVFGGATTWWWRWSGTVYTTAVGEVRQIQLADGSTMTLNTYSRVHANFTSARRDVHLERGEGLFEVAKDASRPFVVHVGDVTVRAVGTAFSVRAQAERVDVTVTEGVVELTDSSGPSGVIARRVAANEHATVVSTREVDVREIPQSEAERQLAWRQGMVDFGGEPLSEAVQEINRHNPRKIVVDDPTLGRRPVVGLFRANDPDGFAATVAAALGATSVQNGTTIHLRLRSSP